LKKKVVYVGVEPDGPHYGFPKRVPEEYVVWFGGNDYRLDPQVRKWMTSRMNDEQVLQELLNKQRSTFTLSDERCRRLLILLLNKVRENQRR
jgi:hypothetical protein